MKVLSIDPVQYALLCVLDTWKEVEEEEDDDSLSKLCLFP
jgi:hypothetical protein